MIVQIQNFQPFDHQTSKLPHFLIPSVFSWLRYQSIILNKDLVETDCSENYPSSNIDENYPNGHSYQNLALFFNDNELGSKPIFSFQSFSLCLPPTVLKPILHYMSIKTCYSNFVCPFKFCHMSSKSRPQRCTILYCCAGINSPPGFLYHKWTYGNNAKFSNRIILFYFQLKPYRCFTFNLQSSSDLFLYCTVGSQSQVHSC